MGQITQVGGYIYFGDENFYSKVCFLQNDLLYSRIQNNEIDYTISGSILNNANTNLKSFVNNYLGDEVITNKLNWCIAYNTGDSTPAWVNKMLNQINLAYWEIRPANNDTTPTKFIALDNSQLRHIAVGIKTNIGYGFVGGHIASNSIDARDFSTYFLSSFTLLILPSNVFVNGHINSELPDNIRRLKIDFRFEPDGTELAIKRIHIYTSLYAGDGKDIKEMFDTFTADGTTIDEVDTNNPYSNGSSDSNSGVGGGDGTYENIDTIEPTDIPDIPSVGAGASGFITIYNPTNSALSQLGSFLWSNIFDIDTFKKLFGDPMECIIGLGIVPCLPSIGGVQNIKFGNVDTGISSSYLSSQYAKVNCGSISINKYIGSFMDYSPYVKINLFLPYIGFVHLGTDDIMGGSINVVYNVDVLSGDCIAFIKHNEKGVLYSYNGNCLTNIPVTGQNYANALKNYYNNVVGIIPATTNGAAGGGVAGAIGGAATGVINAASNVILNSKPTFQRSGNIGGSAGIMGVQKPFVIIERPNISVPNKIENFVGQTSNITMNLGACKGMTIIDSVHLNGISATSEELAEIYSLLKGGVIL